MDHTSEDLAAAIAEQLPVISRQQESLAAILLIRWLSLTAQHGRACLALTHRARCQWSLSWQTHQHQAKQVKAATLAELFVRLIADMTPEERTSWSSHLGSPSPGNDKSPSRLRPPRSARAIHDLVMHEES